MTSGPFDREVTEKFVSVLDHEPIVIQNRSIREVAAVIDQHVAGGTSAPVLSLFGPTDPLQWAPIGKQNRFVASEDGSIDSISLESVTAAALEMLERS